MKEDIKDMLLIPNHIIYNERGEREERGTKGNKDETKKSNVASKEVFGTTKSLFPIAVSRMFAQSKKHSSPTEHDENSWLRKRLKFDDGESEEGQEQNGEEIGNSSRYPKLMHWVQYKDRKKVFMFKKFDIPLEMPTFTSEEYDLYLSHLDTSWQKDETLYLWDLLEHYELRFYVVYDRYESSKYGVSRTIDEIKHRFYSIARQLAEVRNERNSPYYGYKFDSSFEKHRKHQLEKYLLRSKEKHEEERVLNEELRKVDLLIKKREREQRTLKKLINKGGEGDGLEKATDLIENTENIQHKVFAPQEKYVYLRGSVMHGSVPTLSTKLNKKIEAVMKELAVPDKPMPTKNIHMMYDTLRKNILKMFSLQVALKTKEEEKKKLLEKNEKPNLNASGPSEPQRQPSAAATEQTTGAPSAQPLPAAPSVADPNKTTKKPKKN
jgi:DNA methyltransferase 1-associated protein 1